MCYYYREHPGGKFPSQLSCVCSSEEPGGWSGGGGGGCCWRHSRSNVSTVWIIMTHDTTNAIVSFAHLTSINSTCYNLFSDIVLSYSVIHSSTIIHAGLLSFLFSEQRTYIQMICWILSCCKMNSCTPHEPRVVCSVLTVVTVNNIIHTFVKFVCILYI